MSNFVIIIIGILIAAMGIIGLDNYFYFVKNKNKTLKNAYFVFSGLLIIVGTVILIYGTVHLV